MRSVPLNALRAFEAVGRLGSATLAANELGVTPGAVSKQLKTLQEQVSKSLIERSGVRLSMTPTGEKLYERVSIALTGLQSAYEDIGKTTVEGQLTLQCMTAFATHFLIPRLDEYRMRFPNVSIRMLPSIPPHQSIHPETDVGILFGRPRNQKRSEMLFSEMEFFPVCSPELVGSKKLRIEDVPRHRFIESADGTDWLDWFALTGELVPKNATMLEFGDFNHVLAAAREGLGFAVGDNITSERDLRAGYLVRPFTKSIRSRDLGYYVTVNPEKDPNPQATTFLNWIRQSTRFTA